MAQPSDTAQRLAVRPAPSRARARVAPAAARPQRILVASHGHPAITRGGAEIAAYALFQALQADPAFDAWFLGCRAQQDGRRLGIAMTQPFGEREFVYAAGEFDWFKFANRDPSFPFEFRRLLEAVRPDIVHFHHFMLFGLDAFHLVKTMLPDCRIVLTVHEYLLICHAYGQMVTKKDQHLCYRATLEACHDCFPAHSTADFFLRRHWADLFLPYVDAFIAPSHFLQTRLQEWGLEAARLHVIANLVASPPAPAAAPDLSGDGPLRVGFFGQISRLKGIGVLLQAAALLADTPSVSIAIHGKYTSQPPEFQAEFLEQLGQAGSNVRYHGPYLPEHADALMQGVAIVVVPSIWWENAPVVIQEALRNRRPVICTGIGGMAESVLDGVDGWHIPVGGAVELAALLGSLAVDRERITRMAATIRPHPAPAASLAAHAALYQAVLSPDGG